MSYLVEVFGGFVVFVLLLAWIVGTIWVLIDAKFNSPQSAILWGLVAFFGGILGVLLYVLLGRNSSTNAPKDDARNRSNHTTERPSHRCECCGEEYYTIPEVEISTCRACGGIKVSRVT